MDQYVSDLKAENARLTARVAAGKQLRDIIVAIVGNTPKALLPEPELEAAIAAFDAATAPADAEQARVKAGVREVRRGKPHISPEDARRLTSNDDDDPETQERIDEMNDRMDEENEAGSMRLLAIEKRLDLLNEAGGAYVTALHATNRRLDELAARVQQAEGVARVSRDYVPRHTRRMDQMQREIDNLRKSIEAARQQTPQPTPSAPVVTDSMITILQDWIEKEHGLHEKKYILRDVLKRVFAARDAEEGGR